MALLVVIAAGAMMLSAFATSKQDAKAESSQIEMNDDDWKLVREDVAYCSEEGQCLGRGEVYINRNNGQLRFRYNYRNFDLTEYTGVDGYNYRFWNENLSPSRYCYVYINTRYITL